MFLLLMAAQVFSEGSLILALIAEKLDPFVFRQPMFNQHPLQSSHIGALVTRKLDPKVN
jgi:hypothetical protein